jgi:plasmid stabilization system protein ParE
LKVTYRQAAREDIIRQFRYYLVTLDLPEIAIRESVRKTTKAISVRPIAPRCPLHNPRFGDLRSWPVAGFGAIRVYFWIKSDSIRVIRILHGKRDVRRILERESLAEDK